MSEKELGTKLPEGAIEKKRPRGNGKGWLLAMGALLLFASTLWLDTRENGFPFFYHPDEPDKVDQLITGKWNFHHPLLMLGAAELVKKAVAAPDEEQRLVQLGRWCSAVFAAGAVLCFALLAWRARGWPGFWLVGLLLSTQHQVFELAHYFKEDTALLLGVALSFLALHVYHRKPGWGAAIFAGAACGVAISAKYLGGVMLIPAAAILTASLRGDRGRALFVAAFLAGFVLIVAAINFPVFAHLDVFTHSFGRETDLVEHGERGYAGGQVAIFEYLRTFIVNTTPAVWVLIVAELAAQWKRRDAFDWTISIFPFAFMLLLSCSTKTNDRYFLPATAGFYYLAALGAMDLATLLPANWPRSAFALSLAGLALLLNIFYIPAGLASYMTAFAHDDRREMLAWIRANVPPNAVIAGENRAGLPTDNRPERLPVLPLLPQRIIETKYAANLAQTPEALAGQGIAYLVVSESDYGIFFRKAATTGHLSPELQKRREFYLDLFRQFQPIWQRPRGTAIYLHPGLQIYRLSAK